MYDSAKVTSKLSFSWGLAGTWEVEAELELVATKDGCEAEEVLTTAEGDALTAEVTGTGTETDWEAGTAWEDADGCKAAIMAAESCSLTLVGSGIVNPVHPVLSKVRNNWHC